MRFVITRDPQEFAARVTGFLERRIARNVIATVLLTILDGRHSEALFVYGLDDRGEVSFAGLRTPPWFLLASEIDRDDARDLIATWLEADPDVPGVDGVTTSARAIAAAWAEHTGGATALRMREALHCLKEVHDPPHPAAGELRQADGTDRPLLVDWMGAFNFEAGVTGADQAEAMVDARLDHGRLLVWEDGRPVSMVGVNPAVAGVVRIGPVYTPPEFRRRGYAGHAVASVSRRALADGAARCMLFTDLTNPTSNKIYAEVGYRRAGHWEEHVFTPA
jgi:predicted GNAT family acetyltransferase